MCVCYCNYLGDISNFGIWLSRIDFKGSPTAQCFGNRSMSLLDIQFSFFFVTGLFDKELCCFCQLF